MEPAGSKDNTLPLQGRTSLPTVSTLGGLDTSPWVKLTRRASARAVERARANKEQWVYDQFEEGMHYICKHCAGCQSGTRLKDHLLQ
jgi:hypothetical protein